MRRMFCAMCMASIFGIGAGVYAQYEPKAKDQMGNKGMKDGQVTVSGCVAAGKDSGKYMLTDAMMLSHDMTGTHHKPDDQKAKPAMTGDHSKTKPSMSGDHSMMSYELVGGTDMKAHLGHKVEITGNMAKSDMDHMSKMDKMDKAEKDKMMAEMHMKAMKLNVKSMKMVSASCM